MHIAYDVMKQSNHKETKTIFMTYLNIASSFDNLFFFFFKLSCQIPLSHIVFLLYILLLRNVLKNQTKIWKPKNVALENLILFFEIWFRFKCVFEECEKHAAKKMWGKNHKV